MTLKIMETPALVQPVRPLSMGLVAQLDVKEMPENKLGARSLPIPARAVLCRLQELYSGKDAPYWSAFLPECLAEGTAADTSTGVEEPSDPFRRQFSLDHISGRVWALSQKPRGCRLVQDVIEHAKSDQLREQIAEEMKGHVWEAVRCPNANFVLQRMIITMKPQASQFVIDELLQRGSRVTVRVAKHKYGCRVVQRLLEHCRSSQVKEMVAELLKEVIPLSRHPYGNYVMQQVFERATPEHRSFAAHQVQRHAASLSTDCYGSAIVAKALEFCSLEDQQGLIRALLSEPGLLVSMARTRHGHLAVELVLELSQGTEHEQLAWHEIESQASTLRSSRYGRVMVAWMAQHHVQGPDAETIANPPTAGELQQDMLISRW
eukprot:TRINITY_DN68473_c0_g1_i1.p1 TRINITY_DN68473_c0_g1~~TRINITY_DN68473_c0_g1_i1.p1  ORF type:complete len:377 (-),score=60.20 TRINITY_DN68473_c0_g1_i1:245-1375(-)